MNKYLLMASLALGASSFATSSQALTVSGGSFSNTLQTTEINQSGTLSLFDSTLGTLTGITFTFTGQGQTSFSATNGAAGSVNANISSTIELYYGSTNPLINAAINALSNPLVILSSTTGVLSYAPGETKNFGPFNPTDSFVGTSFASFAPFIGNAGDTFTVSCESFSGIAIQGGGGNISTSQTTQAACGASIEYQYDEAPPPGLPAPASLSLIGVGVAAFAAVRRRKAA